MHSVTAAGVALLACAGQATAARFTLNETYDATNFFDKFDFFSGKDPAGGHVAYQTREDALKKGLIATLDDEVYIGADHKTVVDATHGRPSVRLESKASYLKGLMIARFNHLPNKQCGVWPEFWTKGANRPHDGQIDIYEHWNEAPHNQPALHTGLTSDVGLCQIDNVNQTGTVAAYNCDNNFEDPPKQGKGSGCSIVDTKGPWADKDGGVFAMEWTEEYLKLYNWHTGDEPDNIDSAHPDTSSWGLPNLYVKNDECNIDKHFGAQKMVLHITFCGVAGTTGFWGETCLDKTKTPQCVDYVSNNPADFKNTFWKVRDIRYFQPAKSCKKRGTA